MSSHNDYNSSNQQQVAIIIKQSKQVITMTEQESPENRGADINENITDEVTPNDTTDGDGKKEVN